MPLMGFDNIVYFPTGDPRTSEMATLYALGDLGKKSPFNLGTPAAPNIAIVQLVQFKAAVSCLVGELLWWDDRLNKVVTNVSNGGVVAGVVAKSTNPGAGTYGWIYKAGGVPVKYLDAPTVSPDTAGKSCIASATNGRADCVTAAGTLLQIGRTLGAQDGTSKLALTALNIPDEYA